MYVDLNQIRAGEAATPESSRYSSVWYRIQSRGTGRGKGSGKQDNGRWLAPLTLEADHLGDMPCEEGYRASDKGLLTLELDDYLRLLDWAGRQLRADKRGVIPADLAPILERLGICSDEFLDTLNDFPRLFPRLAGKAEQIYDRAKAANRRGMHGVRHAALVFKSDEDSE